MKYRVLLRGENFPVVDDGKPTMLGFFTNRTVRADDESDAELAAVALIKSDESLLASLDRSVESNPMVYCEQITPARWWSRLGGAGYTFFPMDDESEDGG